MVQKVVPGCFGYERRRSAKHLSRDMERRPNDYDDPMAQPLQNATDYLPLDRLMTRANRTAIGKTFWNNKSYHNRPLGSSVEFRALQSLVEQCLQAMLNAKELARVLNANVHPKLFQSWLIMSPNATLLAYSGKHDIQQLRDRAALLSQVWKEHKDKLKHPDRSTTPADAYSSSASTTVSTVAEGALETLTVETPTSNIIIRAVQPRLLLVLIGGPPPHRSSDFFKITAEAKGDPRYPEDTTKKESSPDGVGADDSNRARSQTTQTNGRNHDEAIEEGSPEAVEIQELTDEEKMQMLNLQRKKIDAAAEFLKGDFTSRNFVMPDEGLIQ